jgi:hypothetical protein
MATTEHARLSAVPVRQLCMSAVPTVPIALPIVFPLFFVVLVLADFLKPGQSLAL